MARKIRLALFVLLILSVEFIDELVFGVFNAAWHLIRDDLSLSYVQIGLALSGPSLFAFVLEGIIGILGDVWKRRVLIIGGGIVFTGGLILLALSYHFWVFLSALLIMFPASGAFVNLAQASLMDYEPDRHQQNMARWTFAGSGANVAGPFLLSLAVVVGLGWRGMFIICALISGSIVLALLRQKFPTHTLPENNHHDEDTPKTFRQGWQGAVAALKRPEVIRWLVLLEFSDFMLDILFGFLALYFVDVVGASDSQASLAVGIGWGIGLIGDFLIIPLLERINGLRYLRYSAALELVLFTGFLLAPGLPAKVILISSVAFFSAGWYSILKGELYTAMRGQSGTVMAINTVSGLFGSLIPITLGAIASQFGLGAMMWVLLAGPIAFLIGLPRGQTLVVSAALVE